MWMTASDKAAYPELYAYMGRLRSVLTGWKIVKYMKKYGCMDKEAFGHALLRGTAPLVVVDDYLGGSCGHGGRAAFGCFDEAKPHQIGLDKSMVKAFEADPTAAANMETSGDGNFYPRVGRVIFHELVHWGNFWCGGIAYDPWSGLWLGNGETFERGEAFDRAVYGKYKSNSSFATFEDEPV